jgi:pimeloyl-ACP methyl ester carboxylesterase
LQDKGLYYKKYLKKGCDQWVTFIHGAGGSSVVWHKQLKYFNNYFNLLFIDLRGHGKSNKLQLSPSYNLNVATKEIVDVLDHLKISSSLFVGVSLGTIIATKIAKDFPEKVKKMILCGAITKLSFRTNFLLHTASFIKSFTPPILLYRLFAYIIMPKTNHKDSRLLFINEARKIRYSVFKKWLSLIPELKVAISEFSELKISKPTLFISGEQDYLFVNHIKEFVESRANCDLFKIPNSGHVANNDQSKIFNSTSIKFLLK